MGRRRKKHGDGDLFPLYATIDMPMLATSKKARTTKFKMGLSPSSKPNAMGGSYAHPRTRRSSNGAEHCSPHANV